jgi:hypothetical protein
MAKSPKQRRLTSKRKLFLNAIKALEKCFDDNGLVKDGDSDVLADELLLLIDKCPKSLSHINSFAPVLGSALYVLQHAKSFREPETCSETCMAATPFEAAFFAGWSIGFEQGRDDAKAFQKSLSKRKHAKKGKKATP